MIYPNLITSQVDMEIAAYIENRIPMELKKNIAICGSSLGNCVFVSFWSNLHIPKTYKENSNHYFQIMIDTDPRYGGLGTLEFSRCYNTSKLRGVKKPTDTFKLATKVVEFITNNKVELINFIKEERC